MCLAVVRAVVVPVTVLVVTVVMVVMALVMAVMPGRIIGPVARLRDPGSADHDRARHAEQCDCP
jgi:hypothetical protein